MAGDYQVADVRDALPELPTGEFALVALDDPSEFSASEVEERAADAREDDEQLDLSDKCASCNWGPEVRS